MRRLLTGAFIAVAAILPVDSSAALKVCCDVIRVNAESGAVWVRNPLGGLLAEFHPEAADLAKFKVGDRFDPDTNVLNGTKLETKFAYVEPELAPANATIFLVRGARVTVKLNDTGALRQFHLLSFGALQSGLRPGQEIVIDESGGWAFIRWISHTAASIIPDPNRKLTPQTYAFKLD